LRLAHGAMRKMTALREMRKMAGKKKRICSGWLRHLRSFGTPVCATYRNVITLLSNMKVLFVLAKKTSKSNYIDLFNLNVISPGTLACTPPHFLS